MAAALLALVYLLTSVLIASHRLFWYDEILTVMVSQLPDYASIWKALAHGADGMPPAYYILVRIFERLPMPHEIAARLPSALAMVAGMLITFDCARRLSDGVHGLIAFSVLTCSVLPYYGYEARPYSLYFMFASLALWLWTKESSANKVSSVLFGGVIFLAIAVHYYAVLCLVPYAAWEVFNWRQGNNSRGKFIAGCLGTLCAAALFSRQILALGQMSHGFWAPPTLPALVAIFSDFFPYGLFPLIGIMIWIALLGPNEKGAAASAMEPYEQLGWFFGLIPIVGYALAKLGTGAFYHRYFIALLPGFAVAFSSLLWRQFRRVPRVTVVALLLFASLGLGTQFWLVRHPSSVHPLAGKWEPQKLDAMLLLENKMPASTKQFIVLPASDMLSVEAPYYSKHPEKYVFLVSDNVSARGAMHLGRYSAIRRWTLDDLKVHLKEVVLVNPTQETLDSLEQARYKTTCHINGDLQVVTVE